MRTHTKTINLALTPEDYESIMEQLRLKQFKEHRRINISDAIRAGLEMYGIKVNANSQGNNK